MRTPADTTAGAVPVTNPTMESKDRTVRGRVVVLDFFL